MNQCALVTIENIVAKGDIYSKYFSYYSTLSYIVGTQKNLNFTFFFNYYPYPYMYAFWNLCSRRLLKIWAISPFATIFSTLFNNYSFVFRESVGKCEHCWKRGNFPTYYIKKTKTLPYIYFMPHMPTFVIDQLLL